MASSRNTDIRSEILSVMEAEGEPLAPSDVAKRLEGSKSGNVSQTMRRMRDDEQLVQPEKWGPYQLPSRGDKVSRPSGDGSRADLMQQGRTVSPKKQLHEVMQRQIDLAIYPDVRPVCGDDGSIVFDEATKIEVKMPALLLERLLGFRPPPVMGMMMCQGDSMKPIFEEDDPLLYRPSPDVDSDGNYSFYLDDRLRAKRVEIIPGGGFKLISANTRDGFGHYQLIPGSNGHLVNAETKNEVGFQPVGKILWPRRDTGRLHIDQVADLLHSVVQQNR